MGKKEEQDRTQRSFFARNLSFLSVGSGDGCVVFVWGFFYLLKWNLHLCHF